MKRRWLLLPLLLMMVACGGGSIPPEPPLTASGGAFEGPWKGSLHTASGEFFPASALVLASGEMHWVASNGMQTAATFSATSTSVSGAGGIFAPMGTAFPNGALYLPVTLTGSGTGGAYDSGTFSFTYNHGAGYDTPVIMANVAGAYAATTHSTAYPTTWHLSPTGAISGADAVGTLSGTLSAVDASKNAFHIRLAYAPAGKDLQLYNGLAYFDFSGSPVRLEVLATGTSGQMAAELALTAP